MEPVTRVEGTALPLDRADVDTDQIIPAQYLKRVERTGFGPFLFDEWRKDPAFIFNDERYGGASILLAGPIACGWHGSRAAGGSSSCTCRSRAPRSRGRSGGRSCWIDCGRLDARTT